MSEQYLQCIAHGEGRTEWEAGITLEPPGGPERTGAQESHLCEQAMMAVLSECQEGVTLAVSFN